MRVPDWPAETTQAGDAWRSLLPRLGGQVSAEPQPNGSLVLTASGTGQLCGIDADLSAVGELAPSVAALALLASAQGHASRLRGIAHLRGHETNRLEALVTEMRRVGAVLARPRTVSKLRRCLPEPVCTPPSCMPTPTTAWRPSPRS